MAEPHISTMSYHVLKAQAHFNLFKKTVQCFTQLYQGLSMNATEIQSKQ